MAIIILPVCFIAILLNLGLYAGQWVKKREILLAAILIFSLLLAGITELLSAFQSLNFSWIFTGWSVITLAALSNLFKNRAAVYSMADKHRQKALFKYQRLSLIQKALLGFVSLLLLVIFIQGIIYPPNNWDSMTYHMGRIVSWVSNHSVSFYPTGIIRQLYQPPFAEYVIMHVDVMNRSDHFSNSVQLFFFAGSVITLTAITQQLGLGRVYQTIAALLAATLPEALLQASSTQNDVVVSFFILTTGYFAIRAVKRNQLSYYCFCGIAAGLALLTKGTAYIYLAPVLILFAIVLLRNAIKYKSYNYIGYGLISYLLLTGVNMASYVRNYQFNKSFLGVDKHEAQMYANEHMSAGLLASALIKNSSLHLSIDHTGAAARMVDTAVKRIHTMMGADINDARVNYYGMAFSSRSKPTSEDSAPNPIHFVLLVVSAVILLAGLLRNRVPAVVVLLYTTIILQILLFCAYLKWQPWHTRLHVPVFMLAIPLICYAISLKTIYKKILYAGVPLLLLYAAMVICFNNTRPFKANARLTANLSPGVPRYQKFFAAKPDLYAEYKSVTDKVRQLKLTHIGLITGADDWVYPLFTHCFSSPVHPVYIAVNNASATIPTQPVKPEAIIAFRSDAPFIEHGGRRYYKQTGNISLNLYK